MDFIFSFLIYKHLKLFLYNLKFIAFNLFRGFNPYIVNIIIKYFTLYFLIINYIKNIYILNKIYF